jgi:hypothetical protein
VGVTDQTNYESLPIRDFFLVKQERDPVEARELGCRAGDGIRFYLQLSGSGGVVSFPGFQDVFVPQGQALFFPAQLAHRLREPQQRDDSEGEAKLATEMIGVMGTFMPQHGGITGFTVAWPLWGHAASCFQLMRHEGRESPMLVDACDRLRPLRVLFAKEQLSQLISTPGLVLMGIMLALWMAKKFVSHSVRNAMTSADAADAQEMERKKNALGGEKMNPDLEKEKKKDK